MSLRLASRTAGLWATFAAILVIAGARPAAAQCGGTQLCGAGAGDCAITAADCTITLPAGGLVINLGARRLVLTKNLRVNGPAGASLTVNAGDVLFTGGSIVAPGAADLSGFVTAGNVTILSATNFTVQNGTLIDVSSGGTAGSVDVEALNGTMSFNGRIKANGTTRAAFGGFATVFATGNTTVNGATIDVSGGDMADGGSISIDSLNGSMFVDTPLNAAGGDGGDIEISAGTTLQTTSNTLLKVGANGDAGSGGSVDISSFDNLTIGGETTGNGSPAVSVEDQQSGGDGADVDVFSQNGTIAMNGKVDVSAASAGIGGTIDIDAGLNLTFAKPMVTQGTGIDGGGGDILLSALGTMSLSQTLDVRGGVGSAGTIDAEAVGDLTVSASLLADGDVFGGSIFLAGCAVNITSAALVSSQGPGALPAGTNTVQAGSAMTIRGTLRATLHSLPEPPGRENVLQYRQAPVPSTTGASFTVSGISVPPTVELVLAIPCCLNCPVTTTTTSTTTTSTTIIGTTTTTRQSTTTTTSSTTTTTTTTSTTTSTTSTTTSTTSTTTTTTLPGACGSGNSCPPCQTCDASAGCITAPRPSCRRPTEPEKAQLKLKDSLKGPKNDQLQWKWTKGAATALADFGNPVTSDGVALCIFDVSQATPSLIFQATVPPGGVCGTKPCWAAKKGKVFKFANKIGEPDGVTALTLTSGESGKAKIQLKGKGTALRRGQPLGLPSPSLPLPLTVQLQSDAGQCWEAHYQRSGVKKNAGEDFDAKSD